MKFTFRNYLAIFSHPAHGSGLKAWFGTLSRNRFAIHPAFILKVIFVSITVILSSPFRCYERIKYRKALSKIKIISPVFILGHPRSGTTFLHYLMSKNPSFAFCTTFQAMLPHLFLSGSRLFPPLLSKVLPRFRPMDNLKMGTFLPKEEEFAMASIGPESLVAGYLFPQHFIENFKKHVLFDNNELKPENNWKQNFDYFLRKISYSEPGKTLLLKSPGNTGRIKQILSLYPDAKFIHISRNPFDVYQSNVHLYKKLLPLISLQKIQTDEVERFVLESYRLLLERYDTDKKLIPAHHLVEIKYEDFIKEPLSVLERIFKDLELKNFSSAKPFIKNEIMSYKYYQKNVFNLSPEDRSKVLNEWKAGFEKFGYSKDSTNG